MNKGPIEIWKLLEKLIQTKDKLLEGNNMIRDRENTYQTKKKCLFCKSKVKTGEIDYKDANNLSRYLNRWNKIDSRKRNGNCTKHQREMTTAIKRARHLALLPFTVR